MKQVLGGLLLVITLSAGLALAADKQSKPVLVAQACSQLNQGCGNPGNAACCTNLWCQNGTCQKFQQANQPCGTPATPPCQPNVLACIGGKCVPAK